MRQALHLSRLYLTSQLRRQLHLATLVLALVLALLPTYVEAFSMGTNAFERVSKDFGITMITYFSVGLAILLGSTSLRRDLESRAVAPLLARPISRGAYLLAHFLSMATMLGASVLLLDACLTLALAQKTGHLDSQISQALLGAFLQAAIVASFCLLASVRCSPPLAGTIGAAVFLIGSMSAAFINFFLVEDRGSQAAAGLANGLKALLPNLALFDLKDAAVHEVLLPSGYLTAISFNAAAWIVLTLLLGRILLQRMDL